VEVIKHAATLSDRYAIVRTLGWGSPQWLVSRRMTTSSETSDWWSLSTRLQTTRHRDVSASSQHDRPIMSSSLGLLTSQILYNVF